METGIELSAIRFFCYPPPMKAFQKLKSFFSSKKLNPQIPEQRRELIQRAVERTVKEYGEALKRLGAE